jgi:energy-coupling factor transporter transmembrane protein EcfT
MDFWASNFGILLFGLIEAVAFMWLFGSENAWAELKRGAKMPMPRILYYVMKYITPLFIAALLIGWMYTEGWDTLTMANVKDPAKRTVFLAVRLGILLLTAAGCFLIWRAGIGKETAVESAAKPDEAKAQEVKPV